MIALTSKPVACNERMDRIQVFAHDIDAVDPNNDVTAFEASLFRGRARNGSRDDHLFGSGILAYINADARSIAA